MPYKNKEAKKAHDAAYHADWYQRNKEAIKARIARNKRSGKDRWLDYKSSVNCVLCNASHPAIIDFHHVERDGTQQSVNRMASDNRWRAIYKEIEKCVPICANCHRIGHFLETHESSKNLHEVREFEKYFRVQKRQETEKQEGIGLPDLHEKGRVATQGEKLGKISPSLSGMETKEQGLRQPEKNDLGEKKSRKQKKI